MTFGENPSIVKTVIQDQFGAVGAGPVAIKIEIVLSATMRTVDDYVIFAGEKLEVTVAADGSLNVALPPNTEGTHYDVTYRTPNGVVTEKWIVPESQTPVRLKDVRVS